MRGIGLNDNSPKDMLYPRNCEYNHIWKKDLYRSNEAKEVKIRSFWMIQGDRAEKTWRRQGHGWTEAQLEWAATSLRLSLAARSWKGKEWVSLRASRNQHLDFRLLWKKNSSCIRPPSWRQFGPAATGSCCIRLCQMHFPSQAPLILD